MIKAPHLKVAPEPRKVSPLPPEAGCRTFRLVSARRNVRGNRRFGPSNVPCSFAGFRFRTGSYGPWRASLSQSWRRTAPGEAVVAL